MSDTTKNASSPVVASVTKPDSDLFLNATYFAPGIVVIDGATTVGHQPAPLNITTPGGVVFSNPA